jgi:hypothetical protein
MGFRRAGGWAGAGGADWVGPLARPNPVDFLFFQNIFFPVQEQIQKMPRKCLETRKIPRKSQKFQQNS